MSDHQIVCEICRAPATCQVQDVLRRDNHIKGIVQYEPFGEVHAFCATHARESETIIGSPIFARENELYDEGYEE